MTQATCERFSTLKSQYAQTLGATAAARHSGARSPSGAGGLGAPPPPQVLTVTLAGRVLTAEHVRAGSFIPPEELEEARAVLHGAGGGGTHARRGRCASRPGCSGPFV